MKKSFFFFIALFLFLFFAPIPGFTQEEESAVSTQLWLDITLFNEFSNRIEFYGDGGYRRIFSGDRTWNRLYIRPAIKYSPVPWLGIRAGFGVFFTDNISASNLLELRPWQGISVNWPKLRHLQFSHYLRLEQRYRYDTDTWKNSYDLRTRYQLSSRFQPNITKKVKYVYFPAFIEVFSNQIIRDDVDGLFADEVRAGVGIGYTWNLYWSGQFSFIALRSRNDVGDFHTTNFLFRFTMRHELVPQRDMKRLDE